MFEHAFRILFLLCAALLCGARAHAQVRHVDLAAPPGGDGSSWATALSDLTLALSTASSAGVAEVWVAEGRYVPSSGGFVLPSDVLVYGGFQGTETSVDQRTPGLHPTVLDGDVNGDDQPNWIGYAENVSHVVRDAAGGRTHLDGFTVRGGRLGPGAGLFLQGSEVALANLVVKENRTFGGTNSGGGAELRSSEVEVRDCVFRDNRATGGGGLLLREPENATIERCLFERNSATGGASLSCSGDRKSTRLNSSH